MVFKQGNSLMRLAFYHVGEWNRDRLKKGVGALVVSRLELWAEGKCCWPRWVLASLATALDLLGAIVSQRRLLNMGSEEDKWKVNYLVGSGRNKAPLGFPAPSPPSKCKYPFDFSWNWEPNHRSWWFVRLLILGEAFVVVVVTRVFPPTVFSPSSPIFQFLGSWLYVI